MYTPTRVVLDPTWLREARVSEGAGTGDRDYVDYALDWLTSGEDGWSERDPGPRVASYKVPLTLSGDPRTWGDWLHNATGENGYFGEVDAGERWRLGAHRVPKKVLDKLRQEETGGLEVVDVARRQRSKLDERVDEVKMWWETENWMSHPFGGGSSATQ